MRRSLLAAALLSSSLSFAQVNVQVNLPSILFPHPPALVTVQPGVQVVEDYDEEVFFVDNHYWVRRGDRWYRTPKHNGTWVVADAPATLVKLPPGHYKRWKGKKQTTVIVDTPGPGKVKIKGKKHH